MHLYMTQLIPPELRDAKNLFCRDVYNTLVSIEQHPRFRLEWRLQQKFLSALFHSSDFLPSELIVDGFVPCCFRVLLNGAVILRQVSVVAIPH